MFSYLRQKEKKMKNETKELIKYLTFEKPKKSKLYKWTIKSTGISNFKKIENILKYILKYSSSLAIRKCNSKQKHKMWIYKCKTFSANKSVENQGLSMTRRSTN